MSTKAIERVLANGTVAGSARLLLLVLAHFADDDGRCIPSREELAQAVGVGIRQVTALLHNCERSGALHVERRSGYRSVYTVVGVTESAGSDTEPADYTGDDTNTGGGGTHGVHEATPSQPSPTPQTTSDDTNTRELRPVGDGGAAFTPDAQNTVTRAAALPPRHDGTRAAQNTRGSRGNAETRAVGSTGSRTRRDSEIDREIDESIPSHLISVLNSYESVFGVARTGTRVQIATTAADLTERELLAVLERCALAGGQTWGYVIQALKNEPKPVERKQLNLMPVTAVVSEPARLRKASGSSTGRWAEYFQR